MEELISMSENSGSIRWKSYLPTLVFLIIIVGLTVWYYLPGFTYLTIKGVPSVTPILGFTLIVVGIAAGLLGGLVGTGGCSIMLPVLYFWLGYPATVAIGTTLFAVFFTATSGAYGHLIHKNVDKKTAVWLAGLGVVGVVLGSWFFTKVTADTELLGLILGLAFILPTVRMFWEGLVRTKMNRQGNSIPGSRSSKSLFGFVIGVLTGLVGLGGGYALVPGLIYIFGAPVYITMGTSLAAMIPLAVVGGVIKFAEGFVDLGTALLLGAGAIVGAQIGASIIKRFKPSTLKLIFGIYFLYVSLKFIFAYFGILYVTH